MLVGHFSDLHGALNRVLNTTETPDLWIATGDIFPNSSRGYVDIEVPFQEAWWAHFGATIAARFKDRPIIVVDGNHDYISFADCLRQHGVEAYKIEDSPVVLGKRFAGFREIPWIAGEWNGETVDFQHIVDRTFEADPDILLTHAPPAGILDHDHFDHGYGVRNLTQALTYRPHRITAHFFGHMHERGGQDTEEMGIRFYNGATKVRFVTV